MPLPPIPSELPEILGRSIALVEGGSDIGSVWSLGLDGLGFILDTLDQELPFEFRSYEVQSIPMQKPRIDDETEPGEQTLAAWWARAQHSWHEGAGQRVFDSAFSSRFRYCNAKNLDPWSKGEMKLLKETTEYRNDAVDDHHLWGHVDALLYTRNGNMVKDTDPDTGGETVIATHNGVLINSITSDGESLYAAFSGGSVGIRRLVISSWSGSPIVVNTHTAVDIIGFVKGRLLGGKANQLFEYDLANTAIPDPFYTDQASNWRWSGITEAGPAIYCSGFAGERSEIFAVRFTAQDIPFAAQATLGAPRSVWTAPEGEIIRAIKGYIGQQVIIGTSKGIRIGTVATEEGDLAVSALITKTSQPVLCLEPQLEFCWFGWSTYDGSSSGLGRVDLGNLAFASDLMFTSQGEIKDVVTFKDRRYFVVDEGATSRIIKEHAVNLAVSGFVQNCDVRFNTTETKVVRFFDILATGSGEWSLEMSVNGGIFSPLSTEVPVAGYHEEVLTLEGAKFGTQITLHRNDSDPTLGPVLQEWRLRAEPRATGKFRYLVPVMLYDQLELLNGTQVSENGLALALLTHLTNIYRTGRDVQFDPVESGVPDSQAPFTVVMEDLRFKTFTPPQEGRGFGGTALMILREVR